MCDKENPDEYNGWPNYETWLAFTHATDYSASVKFGDLDKYWEIIEAARNSPGHLRIYWEDMCELRHKKKSGDTVSYDRNQRVMRVMPESSAYEPWWEDRTWYVGILNNALNKVDWTYLAIKLSESA